VIRQLYRGLVRYDQEGAPALDLAASIESEDNTTWTITLKEGYTFTNGEPVNADAFIRAWNYAADGDNTQNNAYFMSRIAGIEESAAGADELSGLAKVDDLTFTVTLSAPFVGFPTIVGYSGFFPVAEECLADFDACNETPIGNGPYKIEGSWDHNIGITLVRNDDFPEAGWSNPDTIEYRIYSDIGAGYAAFQAGEIDFMYTIPPERYQEIVSTYADTLFEQPSDSFTYVGFPLYNENFQNPQIRQALSMAIDRQAIIDNVFDGRFVPATGLVFPEFAGARTDVCAYCVFDPEAAAALLEEAGGWQGGTLKLEANAGAGHEVWMQAVGDQLRANLGIEYELAINLEFPEYLARGEAQEYEGPFRRGWGPDYPFLETYLGPLHATDGSANDQGYSNPDVDALLVEGAAAATLEEAYPIYNQAEDVILEDMPVIPMWFQKVAAIWGENVTSINWNPVNDAQYGLFTMAG
jgi:ABC-type oligopeptide transport system substrate-binding subunit